ncbi:MAG TPA: hypothetical protein VHM70_29960 [Polyangiaceae bacterium]|jgi:hypothetical protein|nr:hypothetical protein [Polyangiaceae bacterium]
MNIAAAPSLFRMRQLAIVAAAACTQFACTVTTGGSNDDADHDSGPTDSEPADHPTGNTTSPDSGKTEGSGPTTEPADAATSTLPVDSGAKADAGMLTMRDAGAIDGGASNGDAGPASSDAAVEAADAASQADAGNGGPSNDAGIPADACSGAYTSCQDQNTLLTCVAAGEQPVAFACTDGCDQAAQVATCKPLVLDNGWFVHQFNLADDPIQTAAAYSFSEGGLVAVQTQNPMASVYVKDQELSNVVVKGSISVTTASDDDYFGFVFGWQDPEHFYLLDWKQAQQDDAACGLAEAGFALKVINSDEELTSCEDLWAAAGSSRVTPLVSASSNPTGWEENVTYDFTLVYKPGAIHVTLTQGDTVVADLSSSDTTYESGRFGFYNYSQEGVRYEFFTINPVAE